MDKDLVDGINRVLNFLKPTDEPQQKKLHADAAAATHPALTDPVWLDATFLVGPDKTELKANRACLAAMNPVMKNMLYGTGFIVVDPMKAIDWPDHQVEALRLVFNALMTRHRNKTFVPIEFRESGKKFTDYICETGESLNVYVETEFQRGRENGSDLVLV